MNKLIFLLFMPFVFHNVVGQKTASTSIHKVSFTLEMLPEIVNPDSLAIMWLLLPEKEDQTQPEIHLSFFPKGVNNIYKQTIEFPDSVMGRTFGYAYKYTNRKRDFYRGFILEKNKNQNRDETWGYLDGIQKRVKPTVMLFIAPESPDEIELFEKPYVGITTDGMPVKKLFPIKKTGVSTAPVKKAVDSFLASLSAEQRATAAFPVQSKEWRRWHNIERWNRKGVLLEDLSSTQKGLAFAFLKESLSAKGYKKVKDIMSMESYLATLVPDNKFLGGEKYWFAFFGTPSDTEPWGWQIEGHHLVINYFILGDQVVMTPTFMGSEPTIIKTGENKGLRTFEAEEKKGLNFYLSLTDTQKKTATLWNEKGYDFNRAEAFRDNEIIAKIGLPAAQMTKSQQAALLDLISQYVNDIREGHASIKMDDVANHLGDTYFTWVQGDNTDGPFYYRIHSPVVLIEFDHQTPVFLDENAKAFRVPVKTHIHTVVRTPNGNDYGMDLLRQHLEKYKH